jgi:hypothetical protein
VLAAADALNDPAKPAAAGAATTAELPAPSAVGADGLPRARSSGRGVVTRIQIFVRHPQSLIFLS